MITGDPDGSFKIHSVGKFLTNMEKRGICSQKKTNRMNTLISQHIIEKKKKKKLTTPVSKPVEHATVVE
jgi:hypothetical protein